jgi:hypothetical protein
MSDYGLDDLAIGVRSPAEAKDISSNSVSRPALRPAQSPVQWVPGVLSLGQSAAHLQFSVVQIIVAMVTSEETPINLLYFREYVCVSLTN